MIKQIKYFQAVVRCQSFTEAAEECFISQSAISQQIQALERELGVELLKREKRKFFLTPAGEYFYKKSLVLINDFDRLCMETVQLAKGVEQTLTIGYLKNYQGDELQQTIPRYQAKHPDVVLHILSGTHVIFPACLPDIFTGLRTALGFSYTTLVAAEMVAAENGIGWMVLDASKFLMSDVIFVGIILMGVTGILMDWALLDLERRIVPWKGKE